MKDLNEFIGRVAGIDAGIERLIRELDDYWDGDIPSTALMADIAKQIVRDEASSRRASDVLALVEEALVEGDSALKDAAATGFLEAMAVEVDLGTIDARTLWGMVGPESRSYLIAWNQSTGVSWGDMDNTY